MELFVQDLCDRAYEVTLQRGTKTLNFIHLQVHYHQSIIGTQSTNQVVIPLILGKIEGFSNVLTLFISVGNVLYLLSIKAMYLHLYTHNSHILMFLIKIALCNLKLVICTFI